MKKESSKFLSQANASGNKHKKAGSESDIVFTPSELGIVTSPVHILHRINGWIGPIHVVPGASPESLQSAQTLADILASMSGLSITIQEGGSHRFLKSTY